MPKKAAGANESIALRAFAVLEDVVRAAAPMSLDEVTQARRLPKPTAFRILGLLHSAGILRREPLTKRYSVGPRLTAFALDLWKQSSLRLQWHHALEEVVAEFNESCNLTILNGDKVLYLDRVETSRPLRLHLEPGTRVPLHCTASGKLFLCQLRREQIRKLVGHEPLKAYTSTTITGLAALYKDLEKVLATQVGTHDSELFDDSVAIAVPIASASGYIYAAVALHAPSSRESIASCARFLPALRKAALRIASTMTPLPLENPGASGAGAERKGKSGNVRSTKPTSRSARKPTSGSKQAGSGTPH